MFIKKNCHKTGNGCFLFVTVLFMILLLNQHSIAKAKETISFFYSDLIRMKHMRPSCECRYQQVSAQEDELCGYPLAPEEVE